MTIEIRHSLYGWSLYWVESGAPASVYYATRQEAETWARWMRDWGYALYHG